MKFQELVFNWLPTFLQNHNIEKKRNISKKQKRDMLLLVAITLSGIAMYVITGSVLMTGGMVAIVVVTYKLVLFIKGILDIDLRF